MLMFIVFWLVVGLIAGFLANILFRGGQGIVFDIILGLIGAVIGGLVIGAIMGFQNEPTSFVGHIVVAFIGAAILLLAVRLLHRQRSLIK